MQRTIAKCGEGPAIPHTAPEKPMSQQANPALNALGLAARAAAAEARASARGTPHKFVLFYLCALSVGDTGRTRCALDKLAQHLAL